LPSTWYSPETLDFLQGHACFSLHRIAGPQRHIQLTAIATGIYCCNDKTLIRISRPDARQWPRRHGFLERGVG
jgi:hypothetical protein